jgi:hypothetical protein
MVYIAVRENAVQCSLLATSSRLLFRCRGFGLLFFGFGTSTAADPVSLSPSCIVVDRALTVGALLVGTETDESATSLRLLLCCRGFGLFVVYRAIAVGALLPVIGNETDESVIKCSSVGGGISDKVGGQPSRCIVSSDLAAGVVHQNFYHRLLLLYLYFQAFLHHPIQPLECVPRYFQH